MIAATVAFTATPLATRLLRGSSYEETLVRRGFLWG
jgi:hypothetical protein